jgi:hypothetical protein
MVTKSAAAILGSMSQATRKWTTGAVAATSATGLTELTDWKGKTLSTGGGFDVRGDMKILDRIDISGAGNSLGLGASIQAAMLSGAVPDQSLLGVAYGGQKVTGGMAATPPLQIPTNIKLGGNKLKMEAGCGVIDIGEFMSIISVRQSDAPMDPKITMLYRAAQLSSATKKAALSLVASGGKTTFPYTLDSERAMGIRHAYVSAVQDALALGAVAFGVEADGDGLPKEKPFPLCGPASGGQLVTSDAVGVTPALSDEWIETGVGAVELNGVAQDGTGSALSVCAVGATLGFQMRAQ